MKRGWFTETFDTADLRDAKALVKELSGKETSPGVMTRRWRGGAELE
jgi:hypothetical protein